MKLGYIGLGKMGLNMVLRAEEKGHTVVAFNRGEEGREKARTSGAKNVVDSMKEMIFHSQTTKESVTAIVRKEWMLLIIPMTRFLIPAPPTRTNYQRNKYAIS